MPNVYKENESIFQAGDLLSGVYYVLDGKVGLSQKFEIDSKEYDIIFSQIENNTFFGVENFFENMEANYSVKALEETTVNDNPILDQEALRKTMDEQPVYGMQILRSLLKTIAHTADFIIRLDKICVNIAKLEVVGYGVLGYLNSQYQVALEQNMVKEHSTDAFEFFQDSKIALYPLSKEIFAAPFHEFLDEEDNLVANLEKKEVHFFTRLYMLSSKIQNDLYSKEPFFLYYFAEKASLHFIKLLSDIEKSLKRILNKYQSIFSDGGLIEALLNAKPSLLNNQDLVRYVKTVVNTLLSNLAKVGQALDARAPEYYKDLNNQIKRLKELNSVEATEQVDVEESYSVPDELVGATEQILAFAELEAEDQQNFLDLYNQFKMQKDRLSGDDSVKRIRGKVNDYFWKIYTKCYIRFYNSGKMPRVVELMFRYGFFDEELIKPKTIHMIYNYKPEKTDSDLPIYDSFEWLEKIREKEFDPSMSGMGERYDQYLKEEAKRQSRKTIVTPEELDSVEKRIEYEINNMMKDCSKVCSGEIFNYSPILLEEAFTGDSFSVFTKKKMLKETFMKIRALDYSAYYREVRYRDSERGIEEFIKKEILPNIIMLPTWGKKSMVWQVKEKPKDSRGRITVPHFIMEKLDSLVIGFFGAYRWEIVKELLGPLWNDITQMSITAEYTDYVQYFKKNKDLSLEMRDKIHMEFKKFRSDKDRFVNDYNKWIEFESHGRPMANKVVRAMFYRHIPFPKEIRDNIKEMPAYMDVHRRFVNLRRKDIKKLKNKYQKYTKNDQILPRELEEYIEFHLR